MKTIPLEINPTQRARRQRMTACLLWKYESNLGGIWKKRSVAAITTSTSASEAPEEYIEMNNKNLHQHERPAAEEEDRRRVRPFF